MKIRMLVQMADGASRNGQPWPIKGEVVELSTTEAAHLVASGVAEEVTDEPRAKAKRRRASAAAGEG